MQTLVFFRYAFDNKVIHFQVIGRLRFKLSVRIAGKPKRTACAVKRSMRTLSCELSPFGS